MPWRNPPLRNRPPNDRVRKIPLRCYAQRDFLRIDWLTKRYIGQIINCFLKIITLVFRTSCRNPSRFRKFNNLTKQKPSFFLVWCLLQLLQSQPEHPQPKGYRTVFLKIFFFHDNNVWHILNFVNLCYMLFSLACQPPPDAKVHNFHKQHFLWINLRKMRKNIFKLLQKRKADIILRNITNIAFFSNRKSIFIRIRLWAAKIILAKIQNKTII